MERLTFDGNFCDISLCLEIPCKYPGTGCTQRQVWERLKAYEDTGLEPDEIPGGNKIPYSERAKVYTNAIICYGKTNQGIKAIEEMAECQKELCKIILGGGDLEHLAEEIADVTICLEQMRLLFGLQHRVREIMDEKVKRLDDRLRGGEYGKG